MSLQVWMPLNGNIRNYGLNHNVSPFRFEGVTFVDGKIGKCAQFPNDAAQFIYMNGLKLQTGSWCAWIKVLGEGAGASQRIISEGRDTGSIGTNIFVSKAGTTLSFTSHKKSLVVNNAITLNKWTHVAATFGNGKLTLYVNGSQVATTTYTEDSDYAQSQDKLVLGKMSYRWTSLTDYFPFNGQMNDFRIYDHTLSPREVKEISKGLVLHYPLAMPGQENLVTGSNTNSTSTNKWFGHSSVGGNASTIEVDETGTNCVKVTRDSTAQSSWDFLSYDALLMNQLKTNTTYTVSFDAKPSVDGAINLVGLMKGNATNNMTASVAQVQSSLLANKWNHCVYHCTTLDSFDGITISGQVVYLSRSTSLKGVNTTVLFKNIKVEEGEIATPWIPNPADAEYSTLGFNDGIEYDVSGYGNNGTKVGTITYDSDTPRYNTSAKFTDNSYIKHKLPEQMYYATYSFWVKASSYTKYGAIYITFGSPGSGYSPWLSVNTESCKVWAFFGNNSPNYTRGASGSVTTNEWHHCVYVWDNGVAQWYLDGEKCGNAVTYTGRTYIQNTNNATIGNSYTGTNWNGTKFNGQISDFRIYSTALTASDILELYHTPISLTSNGTLMTQGEYVEV